MKLTVGGKKFGEVPDGTIRPVGHKPLRHDVVDESIVDCIENLIRRYQYRPGARDKFLNALGVASEPKDRSKAAGRHKPSDPAQKRASSSPEAQRTKASRKKAVDRRLDPDAS